MTKNKRTPEQQFFRSIPQLSVLEDDQIHDLTQRTSKRKYSKGEFVFFQGEPVDRIYFLEMGRVEVYKSDITGRKLTLWFIEESEIFCLASLFAPKSFASAEVVADSLIYSLSKDDFEEIISTSTDLTRNMIRCISTKLSLYASILDDMAFRKIEVRLARTLLRHLRSIGKHEFCCTLSQGDLASLIGTSREVVGRCLKSFREQGIVSISRSVRHRLIVIRQYSALLLRAEMEEDEEA